MKAKKQSRHGVRAADKTQTSISLRADLLEAAKAQAESEGRTFSNWLAHLKASAHKVPMMQRVEMLKRQACQKTGDWPTHLFINEGDWKALGSEIDFQHMIMAQAINPNAPVTISGLKVVKLAEWQPMKVGRIDAEEE